MVTFEEASALGEGDFGSFEALFGIANSAGLGIGESTTEAVFPGLEPRDSPDAEGPGVDVSQLLGSLPLIGSVSEASLQSASGTASCVAGGMLINTLTLPGRLYLLALHGLPTFELLGHHRARMLVKLRAQMRQDLRADPPRVSRRLRRHGESEGE